MRFEWDPRKARTNLRDHEVSFAEAAECFEDDLALLLEDDNPDHPEQRFILIGESKSQRLLFTVYVEKDDGDLIRIISARKTTKNERRRYEQGDQGT